MFKTKWRSVWVSFLLVWLVGVGSAAPVWAQAPAPTADSPAPETPAATPDAAASAEPAIAPDSPRASLQAYLDLGRQGDWEKAAHYLAVPDGADGASLARRLKAVLDKHVWFDYEQVSSLPGGNTDDGLSPNVERVAAIPVGEERTESVYMVRRQDENGHVWVFSPNTVKRINGWYDDLDDRWIRDRLAHAGLRSFLLEGPFGLLRWQWIALPLLLLLAWALGGLLGRVSRAVLGRLFARTETQWDDKLLVRVGPPLTLAWGLAVFSVALPSLGLTARAEGVFREAVTAGVVVVVFWALWRSVVVFEEILLVSPWAATSPAARNLVQIGSNIFKGVIAGVGVLAVLSAFGYPVSTLLAGLGIGGLAFAFGAQKTVENLFGSISLAIDQPFRVGDFVKVEDFVGTVEEIGIRSTRFRTLDRTVISLPNGSLSEKRLETFAARDRVRLAMTIGLQYSTTHAQMIEVIEGSERVLKDHPKIWPDAMVVKFKEFGASSLDIEIMAWFQVPTWADFQCCRQEVLLGFMKVVEDAGTGFAFPTRTLHVFNEDSPGAQKAPESKTLELVPEPIPSESLKPGNLPVATDDD
jgi:MscS family membrane protein